uniref:LysR substrate-binding domain-containing protein n=1 Tax=Phenylobacterium glaciei TaxID=2803784 RepID=A0A974P7A3_9CAUL|nr:hypothetical protein JKL49_07405 [Phenylobacterium glaciei]
MSPGAARQRSPPTSSRTSVSAPACPAGRSCAGSSRARGGDPPRSARPVGSGSPDLSLQAARGGAGLAFVNCRSASKDLASGTLIQVLADWTPPFPGIALYYPRQRLPSAGLRAFIDCFQAARLR